LRILLADDNDIVRHGMVGLLSTEAEWRICGEARTGAETLLKASQSLPDIVLLDVNLPDMNGLESPAFAGANAEYQDSNC
jgi:YesN/AraC family two-component response regulator